MLELAALVIFATGFAHSFLGERYLLIRLLRRDNLPKLLGSTEFTAGTLRFAWHITTVAWWAIAALLLLASSGKLTTVAVLEVVAAAAVLSAVLPIVFTRGKHLSWVAFLLIAVLTFLSSRS